MCLFRKTLKADLDVKRPTMDKLCSMSQDLLSSVKNREVASKLEARLDSFAQRWEQLVQILEMSITQVQWVLSCLLLYVESCEHHGNFFFTLSQYLFNKSYVNMQKQSVKNRLHSGMC